MTGALFLSAAVRKRPLRLLLIALCAFGCFFCKMGLDIAKDTLASADKRLISYCGLGDINVSAEETQPGSLSSFLRSLGAEKVSEGLKYTARCVCADGKTRTVRFLALSGDAARAYVEGSGEFALSFGYAADFDRENVRFLVLPDGSKLDIAATAYMPGYNAVYADRFTASTDGDIVDVYTDMETLQGISGKTYVNYASAVFPPETELNAVIARLEGGKTGVEYAVKSRSDAAFSASQNLLETVSGVCALLPLAIFAVGLVFICVFLSGVSRRMRHALALLLTDGASGAQLFSALCLTGFAPMLLGYVCAVPGALLLAKSVCKITSENMGVPYFGLEIAPKHFALCFAACVLATLVSASFSLAFVSRGSVLDTRRRAGTRAGAIAADIAVTALCSGAAMCLVAVMLLYKDSLASVRREVLFERWNFDAQVIYSRLVPVSELERLEESGLTEKCESALIGTATLKYGENELEVSGAGIAEDSTLLRFESADGSALRAQENKLILAESTARRLGVEPGDILTLNAYYGGRLISVRCMAAELSRQYSAFTQLVSADTVERYLDSSGVMNSAFVRVKGDMAEFLSYVSSLPDVYAVQTRESAVRRFDSRYAGTKKLINLVIADGVLLGFAVCLLMGYGAWRRNLRKNTVLILLGESPLRLALRDALLRCAGMAAGLALAYSASAALSKLMLRRLSTNSVDYPFAVSGGTMAVSAALTVCYVAVSCAVYCALCKKYARVRA